MLALVSYNFTFNFRAFCIRKTFTLSATCFYEISNVFGFVVIILYINTYLSSNEFLNEDIKVCFDGLVVGASSSGPIDKLITNFFSNVDSKVKP